MPPDWCQMAEVQTAEDLEESTELPRGPPLDSWLALCVDSWLALCVEPRRGELLRRTPQLVWLRGLICRLPLVAQLAGVWSPFDMDCW